MSRQQQLDAVIADVQACFGAFGPDTTLEKMRADWDAVSSSPPSKVGAKETPVDAGGVRAVWFDAPGAAQDRVVLYLHGGGYVLGGPISHGSMAAQISKSAKARVLFVDYRLAPEHPFPAAVEDATAAYRWLLAQGIKPGRIAVSGDSAGGGLCMATLLSIKQNKLPMPACAAPLSPWVDMEALGETMTSKDAVDPIVKKPLLLGMVSMVVTGGKSVRDPLIAPLYGDLSGLPPLLIQVGTRETLLDDARRLADRAKKAGVKVQLHEFEGQIHVFQVFCSRLDEAVEALDEVGAFVQQHTG